MQQTVTKTLRSQMQEAIKQNKKAQIERIAVLFKNVGEQEEGMRLYT